MATHKNKQPEPVLTRAGIITALTVLGALLVKLGAGDVSVWLVQNSNWVAGVILAAGPTVSGWLARRHVTPVVAPKSKDGQHLVPLGSAASTLDADKAIAAADAIFPTDQAA